MLAFSIIRPGVADVRAVESVELPFALVEGPYTVNIKYGGSRLDFSGNSEQVGQCLGASALEADCQAGESVRAFLDHTHAQHVLHLLPRAHPPP